MPTKRKHFSKKDRFTIFARDGFCCRYCGESSESVKLVVDHVVPICQGGTNDPENLISSCESCNQGKGGRLIQAIAPTDGDTLRIRQEYREQEELARITAASAKARENIRQQVCNYYCGLLGETQINRQHLSTLVNILNEVGPDDLFEFMDIAQRNLNGKGGTCFIRYVCGIHNNRKSDSHEKIHRN